MEIEILEAQVSTAENIIGASAGTKATDIEEVAGIKK